MDFDQLPRQQRRVEETLEKSKARLAPGLTMFVQSDLLIIKRAATQGQRAQV